MPCAGLTAGKDRQYMPRCCKWETGRAQPRCGNTCGFEYRPWHQSPNIHLLDIGGKFMKRIDKFTKEEIEQAFKESQSLDAVARKLGYKDNSGGTHSTLKKYVEDNNIDISHFTGQG